MFACCNNCYHQYLNKDGIIDKKEDLDKIFGFNQYKLISNQRDHIIINIDSKNIKLCSCLCHIKGSLIRH